MGAGLFEVKHHKLFSKAVAMAVLFGMLVGCNDIQFQNKEASKPNLAQRKQAVQAVVDAGPQTRSWQTPEGTVIELTIPTATSTGNFLHSQRCIVWRDAVTKTASIQCEREELRRDDFPGDPPEHQQ